MGKGAAKGTGSPSTKNAGLKRPEAGDPRAGSGRRGPVRPTVQLRALAVTRDGGRIAVARVNGQKLRVTTGKGKHLFTITGLPERLRLSPSGKLLALASTGKTVHVRSFVTGKRVAALTHPASRLGPLAFGARETRLYTTAGDRRLRIWDLGTGKLLRSFDLGKQVTGIAFFDGDRAVLATTNEPLRVLAIRTGRTIARIPRPNGAAAPVEMTVTDDGKTLALSTGAGDIEIYDLPGRRRLAVARRTHGKDQVIKLLLTPRGRRLASLDSRGVVRYWRLPSLKPIKADRVDGTVMDVAFDPRDGRFLLGLAEGKIRPGHGETP